MCIIDVEMGNEGRKDDHGGRPRRTTTNVEKKITPVAAAGMAPSAFSPGDY